MTRWAFLLSTVCLFGVVRSSLVGGKEDVDVLVNGKQFVPHVAFHCGHLNQFVAKNGSWVTDHNKYATCLKGKLDILKYCRKVFPDLDVTNIVEASHQFKLSNWCSPEGASCKWSFWVRPYRCIVGEFESEALLVPEGCHFGHVDDRQSCEKFDHWNKTAQMECARRTGSLTLRSFSILEPCGLDMFSGVEFVCCPKAKTQMRKIVPSVKKSSILSPDGIHKKTADLPIDLHMKASLVDGDKIQREDESSEEDDEDDDEEDDDDVIERIEMERLKSATTTTTMKPLKKAVVDTSEEDDDEEKPSANDDTRDEYFRLADPGEEHTRYNAAVKRVESKHKQKVAKVMEEWSELETRHQEMKVKDPKHVEDFRKEMTTRYQKTVAALEAEYKEEKRQLDEVHQQRVMASLNERKRQTIQDYRDTLELSKHTMQAHKVLKALQSYIRAEEKDRLHTLNRYRHLVGSDPDMAAKEKVAMLKRLHDIDLRINGTIDMLRDVPNLSEKVKPVIMDFWLSYREENTPEVTDDSTLLNVDKDAGKRLLDLYQKEYQGKTKVKKVPTTTFAAPTTVKLDPLVDKEPEYTDSDPDVLNAAKKGIVAEKNSDDDEDDDDDDDDDLTVAKNGTKLVDNWAEEDEQKFGDDKNEWPVEEKADWDNDSEDTEDQKLEEIPSLQAHSLNDKLQHTEVLDEVVVKPGSAHSSAYVVFGFAGVALMVTVAFGIILLRRKHSAKGQGFIEVDACTPEEKHVAGMQVNGYENPTYRFFEAA